MLDENMEKPKFGKKFFVSSIALGKKTFRNSVIENKITLKNKNENQDLSENLKILCTFINTMQTKYPDILCKLLKEMETPIKKETDGSVSGDILGSTTCDSNTNNYDEDDYYLLDSIPTKCVKEITKINAENKISTSTEISEKSSEYKFVTKHFKTKTNSNIKATDRPFDSEEDGWKTVNEPSTQMNRKELGHFYPWNKDKHKFKTLSSAASRKTKTLRHLRKHKRMESYLERSNQLDKWQKRKNILQNQHIHQFKMKHPIKLKGKHNLHLQISKNRSISGNYLPEIEDGNQNLKVIGTHQHQAGKNEANVRNYVLTD